MKTEKQTPEEIQQAISRLLSFCSDMSHEAKNHRDNKKHGDFKQGQAEMNAWESIESDINNLANKIERVLNHEARD